MVVIVWIVGIAIYCLIGTVTGIVLYRNITCSIDGPPAGIFGGIFWPIGLWIAIGMTVIKHLEREEEEAKQRKAEEDRILKEAGL